LCSRPNRGEYQTRDPSTTPKIEGGGRRSVQLGFDRSTEPEGMIDLLIDGHPTQKTQKGRTLQDRTHMIHEVRLGSLFAYRELGHGVDLDDQGQQARMGLKSEWA